MSYVPAAYRNAQEHAVLPRNPAQLASPILVRSLQLLSWKNEGSSLRLVVHPAPYHLLAPASGLMALGEEKISMVDYCHRVLELNDYIDVVLDPLRNPLPLSHFWIHIVYEGSLLGPRPSTFKDDGQFAMRAKAGEKAERLVAMDLVERFGHQFAPSKLCSPGVFTIRYADKRERQSDLVCQRCGLRVEVKKRNRDRRYRISHSSTRPFHAENPSDGWHAFVWPDFQVAYVPNTDIMRLIETGSFTFGTQIDTWAELPNHKISAKNPPRCA